MYMLLLLRLSFLHVNLYVQFTSIFNSYNIDVQLSIIKRIPTNGNWTIHIQLKWHSNWLQRQKQINRCKADTVYLPTIIGSPGGPPGATATQMWDAVSATDLRRCGKFQPNPFSSFAADASQKDRQQT